MKPRSNDSRISRLTQRARIYLHPKGKKKNGQNPEKKRPKKAIMLHTFGVQVGDTASKLQTLGRVPFYKESGHGCEAAQFVSPKIYTAWSRVPKNKGTTGAYM